MVRQSSDMVEKTQNDILIIGAEGLLGRTLFAEASSSFATAGSTVEQMDITDREKVRQMLSVLRPRVIVLTAAYTDVDGCEENPSMARAVNVQGVRNVVEAASKIDAALVFLSSDYVFNGLSRTPYREDDIPDPISVYGQTKLEAERILHETMVRSVIVRSAWLFGEGKNGFVQFVLKAIGRERILKIVSDKYGSPTYVVDLSKGLCKIAGLILQGRYDFQKGHIVHIVNSGVCSWYDMAGVILDVKGIKDIELKKIKLDDYHFEAKRPRYSALDNSRFEQITGTRLRLWREALKEFVQCQKT